MTKYITAPLIGLGGMATKASMDFTDGIAKVSTIMDKNVMSVDEMRNGILNLSNKTGKSVSDLTEGMYQTLSANVKTADSLQFLERAAETAKAGFTDTLTSVDGLTTILNSYGLETSKVTDISNQLMVSQNLGKTTFGEMAQSIGNVTPIAASLNVQTQELFASIASLTSQGIQTSSAITGLRSAYSNIVKPSEQATKLAQQLGIEFNSAHLKSVGWTKFLEEIKTATNGNQEQMAKLFGDIEGLNAVLALTSNSGMDIYNQALNQMTGNTDLVAKALEDLDTPGERFRKSLNRLTNTVIQFGDSLAPSLEKIGNVIEKITNKFNQLSPTQRDFLVQLAMIVAVIGPVVMVVGMLTTSVGNTISMVLKFAKAVKSIGLMSAIFTPGMLVVGVILAIATAAFLIIKYWGPIKTFFVNLWNGIKEGALAIWEVIVGAFKGYVNIWISLINFMIERINSINITAPDWIPGIGGRTFGFNIPIIPKLAAGTMYWPGGLAQVSERGGEIIDLPRGSRVYPHDESIKQARKQGQAEGGVSINIPKLADTLIIREEADIHKIARAFASEIKKSNINLVTAGGVA